MGKGWVKEQALNDREKNQVLFKNDLTSSIESSANAYLYRESSVPASFTEAPLVSNLLYLQDS
jgi:hypothetical protein